MNPSTLQYPGKPKYNITRISGTSPTLADTDTYKFADAHQVRATLGWVYGVDHWAFSDVGVPKTVTGLQLKSAEGLKFFAGTKGSVLYETDQTAIKRINKVVRG